MIGAMFPIINLGRPWLFFLAHPVSERTANLAEPAIAAGLGLLAISTYLTGSTLFLFSRLFPSRAPARSDEEDGGKENLCCLALGWQGTTKAVASAGSRNAIMAIAIVPVAVSVHTIVSFDFSMSSVPMLALTVFWSYFVGAQSQRNCAALIWRWQSSQALHLEEYLHPVHFKNLGKLLLMMSPPALGLLIFAERLTTWYGNNSAEMAVFLGNSDRRIPRHYFGRCILQFRHSLSFAGDQKLRHNKRACDRVLAHCRLVMWLERFLIYRAFACTSICPMLGAYRPQPVEIMITVAIICSHGAALALFAESGSHYFDLGTQVRRPSQPVLTPEAREQRELWKARTMKAIYGLYSDPDSGQTRRRIAAAGRRGG